MPIWGPGLKLGMSPFCPWGTSQLTEKDQAAGGEPRGDRNPGPGLSAPAELWTKSQRRLSSLGKSYLVRGSLAPEGPQVMPRGGEMSLLPSPTPHSHPNGRSDLSATNLWDGLSDSSKELERLRQPSMGEPGRDADLPQSPPQEAAFPPSLHRSASPQQRGVCEMGSHNG